MAQTALICVFVRILDPKMHFSCCLWNAWGGKWNASTLTKLLNKNSLSSWIQDF